MLVIENISKEFDGNVALHNISFTIHDNEFLTLLGPSGCGKTTLLNIIAGFTQPSNGSVFLGDIDLLKLEAYKRPVNTVFQNYALFPHMNVFENIAYSLRLRKEKNTVVREEVSKMLRLVKLEGFEDRDVTSLSGGQKQRIAIARALINKPKILLLDEPLAALDLKLRKQMQYELKSIQQELGITFIFVTHDQEEALTMSDRIVVFNDGIIQQLGVPKDIYDEPMNRFVADFIGESTILRGVMHEDYRVSFCGKTFTCVDRGFSENEEVDVVLRPEDLSLTSNLHDAALVGVVQSVLFQGVHYEMRVAAENETFLVHSTKAWNIDDRVGIMIEPEDIHVMELSAYV